MAVERVLGGLLLLSVAVIYAPELLSGEVPPGHPWAGITLGLLGLRQLVWPAMAGPQSLRARAPAMVVIVLTLVSACFWMGSAALRF